MKKTIVKGVSIKKAVLLLLAIVLIVSGIISLVYSSYRVVSYKEYPIHFQVVSDPDVGFNISADSLNFGKLPLESTGKIKIKLENSFSEPLLVVMEIFGDAKKFVVPAENNFILEQNTTKAVEIYAIVPANATTGEYSGKMGVLFKKVNI